MVFHGYTNSPSIKDMAHDRHKRNGCSITVNLTPDMICAVKQETFLANNSNKEKLILLIAEHLRRHGCTVIVTEGDADVDIVRAAVNSSQSSLMMLLEKILICWFLYCTIAENVNSYC